MKNKRTRILAVLLAAVMLVTTVVIGFAVPGEKENPLKVTITTDKEAYCTLGIARFNVNIENVGTEAAENIKVETLFEQLTPVGVKNPIPSAIGTLKPGENYSYDFKAQLNIKADALNPYQQMFLMLENVLYYSAEYMVKAMQSVQLISSRVEDEALLSVIQKLSSSLSQYFISDLQFNPVTHTSADAQNSFDTVKALTFGVIDVEQVVRVWYGEGLPESEKEYVDSDGDDIPDEIESLIGTDPLLDDTDGDGLKDGFEYLHLNTDPFSTDTDENGISDADEDFDGDGLTNIQEQKVGTRPDMVDTDDDGLSDYDEVHIYGTNPLIPDTDGDGLTDEEEIKLGLNPNEAMTDGSTPDANRTFSQTTDDSVLDDALRNSDNWLSPSISGDVAGMISRNIDVNKSFSSAFDDNRAVLSDIIDLYTSYAEPLTLLFNYNQSYTGDSKNLTIVSLGEEGLEIIDTVINETSKTISGVISGTGTYFVIDLDEFLKGLGIDVFRNITPVGAKALSASFGIAGSSVGSEPEYDYLYDNEGNVIDQKAKSNVKTEASFAPAMAFAALDAYAASTGATGKADIAFVIDTTGSMSSAISGVKNNVNAFAEKLVNEYNVDANFSLIEFRDITVDGANSTKQHKNTSSNWFTNVNTFKNEVNKLSVGGGGDTPETPIDGLEMARRLDWRGDATKFVILVTDAGYKTNNNYGIAGMSEMVNLFVNDGIIVSAIAYSESAYSLLTNETDGLYGYIYGNFSDILLGLADKVGEVTNTGGEWVFLSDFQAVKLSDTLDNSGYNDTDSDGLSDAAELGSSVEVDMTQYIAILANRHSVPMDYYTGKTKLTVWKYLSNPTLLDTDYDGISDGSKDYDGSVVDSPDAYPRRASSAIGKVLTGEALFPRSGNRFSGTLSANDFTFNVNFNVDYSLFFDSNKNYKDDLAVLGAIYSTMAYHNNIDITGGRACSGQIEKMFSNFGLKKLENYKIADHFSDVDTSEMSIGHRDDDISEMSIGHREVTYKGITKDVIVVAVRGTDATIEEWSSNFDVGANTDDYWDKNNSYWRDKDNHKGFDVAANRLYDEINRYVGTLDPKTSKSIYITGHSRGAAIANILGAKFEDNANYQSFAYTFATPMTTTATGSYSSVFNIVNKDDIVPYMPLASWGFGKYGKTYEVSIEAKYEDKFAGYGDDTWEALFGVDYNYNGKKEDTLRKFGDAVKSRKDVYKYPGTDDAKYTYATKYDTRSAADAAARKLAEKHGSRINKFCEYNVKSDASLFGNVYYQVEVQQKPAAFMMILTDVIATKSHTNSEGEDKIIAYTTRGADEDKFCGNPVGFFVAKKYADAKTSFVWGGADSVGGGPVGFFRIGGMVHTHMPGSYYLLASDSKDLIPTY